VKVWPAPRWCTLSDNGMLGCRSFHWGTGSKSCKSTRFERDEMGWTSTYGVATLEFVVSGAGWSHQLDQKTWRKGPQQHRLPVVE
jgi:hypothetical protein